MMTKKRMGLRAKTPSLKMRELIITEGSLCQNLDHAVALLSKAGMTEKDFETLYGKTGAKGTLQCLAALRVELHDRGLVPIAGRPAATAAIAAPVELERVISQVGHIVNILSAALPGASLPASLKAIAGKGDAGTLAAIPAASQVDTLRAQIDALKDDHSQEANVRRGIITHTLRQLRAGGPVAVQQPGKMEALRTELRALESQYSSEANTRKTVICRELRTLRAAAR